MNDIAPSGNTSSFIDDDVLPEKYIFGFSVVVPNGRRYKLLVNNELVINADPVTIRFPSISNEEFAAVLFTPMLVPD
jgi:hypothetical protein